MKSSTGPGSPNGRAPVPRGSRLDKTVRIEIAELERAMRKQKAKEVVGALVVIAILAFSFGAALYLISEVVEWLTRR